MSRTLLLARMRPLPYVTRAMAVQPANHIASYPQDDRASATLKDWSGSGRDGSYKASGEPLLRQTSRDTTGRSFTCPLYDGTNDYGNIYSASFAAAWSGDEVTWVGWARVLNSGVWSDAATRRIVTIQADANNNLSAFRTSTNNQMRLVMTLAGVQKNNIQTVTPSTDWMSFVIRRSKTLGRMDCWMNGQQYGLRIPTTETWAGAPASTNTVIGNLSTSGTQTWSGWLGPQDFWSTPLPIADIAYLTGLARMVIYEGDSHVVGAGGVTPWPDVIGSYTPATTGYGVAVGGTTVTQIQARFTANVVSQMNARAGKQIAVMLGGTNDIAAGADAATTYSRIQTWHQTARAAGLVTIASTIPPRNDAFNTVVSSTNTLLRNDHSFADGFCDVATTTGLTDPANLTNYQADGIHWTAAGHVLAAAAFKTVIQAV